MLFDTHMHCEFSCDSEMNVAQAAAIAAKQGIGMIVTEHWDLDYPTNREEFVFDLDAYFKNFAPYRTNNVLCGIEIGMQKHIVAENESIAASHEFDFVLASIHCMNRKDIYEPVCYNGLSREEAVEEFLEDSIYCLEHHQNFDAFAHIDYICRYWPYEGAARHLYLEDNPEKYDKLFKLLIEGGKAFEINTRRLGDSEAVKALLPLYKRYSELGGKYCTFGSDAHYKEHVGRGFKEAMLIAKEANLQPVYFKERKMQLIKL